MATTALQYGNWAGPSGAQFRVVSQFDTYSQGEEAAGVSIRCYVETSGNFYGTTLHTSWSDDVQLYGAAVYVDSWADKGQLSYGVAASYTIKAWYTGNSGTTYTSTLTASITPAAPTWAPIAPASVKHVRVSDSKNTVSWARSVTAARPWSRVYIRRSVDGGSWAELGVTTDGTATGYNDSTTSAGHSYRYMVGSYNSAGTSWGTATTKTLNTPSAPSGVKAKRVSDSQVTVSWTRNCPDSALYASQAVQRSVNGGAWAVLAQGLSGTATSYTDSSTAKGNSYAYRVVAANATGSATSAASSKVYTTPNAPSGVTAALVSSVYSNSTTARVSWTRNAADSSTYSSQLLQRSTDGGPWATVASGLGGTATSYTDSTLSLGHYYTYRVAAVNGSGTSYSAASGAVYTAPSAPTATAVRSGTAQVTVTVAHTCSTATGVIVCRNAYGTDSWVTVYSGSSTTYVDSPGAGTWRYYAQSTRGDLKSGASAPTGWVVPVAPPNAPTITAPASGSVAASGKAVTVAWTHNPADGSAQTKWQAQYTTTGSFDDATEKSGTTGKSFAVTLTGELDVAVRVRTAGVSGEYGPWGTSSFTVRRAPSVTVQVDEVSGVPFVIAWDCGDMSGAQAQAVVEVLDAAGKTALTDTVAGDADTYEVESRRLIPEDGQTYTARVTVRSSYGLTGTGTATFAVKYVTPGVPVAVVEVDEGKAGVSVTVTATESDIPTEHLSVWRDGECLADGLGSGAAVYDPLPPLDTPVTYRATAHAESGAVASLDVPVTVDSHSFFFLNWGSGWGEAARAARGLAPSRSVQHEVETMNVLGSARPVAMYGEHTGATGDLSADVWWLEDWMEEGEEAGLAKWDEGAEWVGDYALRLPHSSAVRVSADVQAERGDTYANATVRVDYTEVAGGLD